MRGLPYILLWLCLLQGFSVSAQVGNLRSRTLVLTSDTLVIDSLSVVPGSLVLTSFSGDSIPSDAFELESFGAVLRIDSTLFLHDSLQLSYRVFPLNFSEPMRHKPLEMLLKERPTQISPYVFSPEIQEEEFGFDGLNKTGSISRGIAFGNTQDLSVNSTLNLQLSGKLTPRINVLASITDDNLPIQPQGNTQQLQDFDQVYIQLYDDRSKLTAGDFQLRNRESYFFRYFKRAQGATFETRQAIGSESEVLFETSAAISKGKFARNVIQGIEGNQGPYRLRGADDERFIIILAGTERVYIDGRLLKRGQEYDYVIDYNTAEVIFTPNQFITKDRRIVVEFQYSDKNYARALLQGHVAGKFAGGKVYLNAYHEQDSKNQPLQQELDEERRAILAAAGDDPFAAVVPAVDSVAFSNDFVLYALRDSLGYDSIYVFSNDPDEAFYRVSFSPVAQGSGDYVEDQFTAVGRVYRWVAPDTIDNVIVRRGTHAPLIALIPAQRQQGFSVGGEWKLGKQILNAEFALSNRDRNTFSSVDNQDNIGTAVKAGIRREGTFRRDSIPWTIAHELHYEYMQQHFNALERFRAVEFERNWNVLGRVIPGDQHIGGFSTGIKKQGLGKLEAGGESFRVADAYEGYKAILRSDLRNERFTLFLDGSYLSTNELARTQFLRHRGELNRRFGKVLVGYKDEHEFNRFGLAGTDTLASNSYRFYEWQGYTQVGDSSSNSLRAFYGGRTDWLASGTGVRKAAVAEQYGARIGWKSGRSQDGVITVSNRILTILDSALTQQEPESTLLGRVEHRFRPGKGWLQTDLFYEIGSGLEQRREFIYLEVPAGQGVYVWIDYDEDGVKDLNEFEIAQFAYEANYIRSFTPTDSYVRTYSNQFSFSVQIKPGQLAAFRDGEGLAKFIGRFSDQFSYKQDRKTDREEGISRFDPFDTGIADTSLLSQNGALRNTLFFDRISSVFGADYTYQVTESKSLLTGGFESRLQEFNQIRLRWNPSRVITVELESEEGRRNSSSDLLENRNFRIVYQKAGPVVSWQPDNTLRLSLNGQYTEKRNQVEFGGEVALLREVGMEFRYNQPSKGSFLASFKAISISYEGESADNSLGFEMLEGLRPGENFTWSASLQRNLSGNLQLNLLYNGRRSEGIRTVHAGGLQVRAYF